MSLRMNPEQIPLTFSSQLVTAVCQESTASLCHCHWPRPSWAIWEAALKRTREIGSERCRKYHRVWHATQHTPPSGHTTVGPIMCVFIWNVWTLFTVQKMFIGNIVFLFWSGEHNFRIHQASHGDPQWASHTLQQPVPQQSVWCHW